MNIRGFIAGIAFAAFAAGEMRGADFVAPLDRGRAAEEEAVPEVELERRPLIVEILQMFNPFAPKRYGGGDFALVYREEDEEGPRAQQEKRARGFRLFSVTVW